MSDCSLISDGAAALVLVAEDMAAGFDHAIGFRAAVQVNDFLPMSRRSHLDFAGPAELMTYEAMGLAPKGQGARVVDEGTVLHGGALPVNLSGGLKAKGNPVGAAACR